MSTTTYSFVLVSLLICLILLIVSVLWMFKIKMFFPFLNYEASDITTLNNSLSSSTSQIVFWRSNRIASSCENNENLPENFRNNFSPPNNNMNNNLSLLMSRSNSKSCNENANNLPEVNSLM